MFQIHFSTNIEQKCVKWYKQFKYYHETRLER